MVEVRTFSQIGNNLFQYAFARLLAEEMGYALRVRMSSLQRFERNNQFLTELMARFDDAPLQVGGRSFEGPEERYSVFEGGEFDGYNLDVRAVVDNPASRKVVLEGYFERYAYFKPHKDKVRRWFRLEPRTLGHPVSDQDILIHIRRGDLRQEGRLLALSYYSDVLEALTWKRIYVCGHGLDQEVRDHFQRFQPVYVEQSPPDDFCFVQAFRRIIQSNSTFIWWATFISRADEVYAPLERPNPFVTLRYPHIDLRVDDEQRYHYVPDVAVAYGEAPLDTKLRFWALSALGRRRYDGAIRRWRRLKRLVRSGT